MTQRAMQVDDPAQIPVPGQAGPRPSRLLETPDEARERQMAQLAGAVSALAGKFGRLEEHVVAQRPPVRIDDRRKAMEEAREFVSDLGMQVAVPDRIAAELSIARYLTGE